MTTESPCIGVCELAEDDTCKGCHRSRAELKAWRGLSDAEKARINARVRPLIAALDR